MPGRDAQALLLLKTPSTNGHVRNLSDAGSASRHVESVIKTFVQSCRKKGTAPLGFLARGIARSGLGWPLVFCLQHVHVSDGPPTDSWGRAGEDSPGPNKTKSVCTTALRVMQGGGMRAGEADCGGVDVAGACRQGSSRRLMIASSS